MSKAKKMDWRTGRSPNGMQRGRRDLILANEVARNAVEEHLAHLRAEVDVASRALSGLTFTRLVFSKRGFGKPSWRKVSP